MTKAQVTPEMLAEFLDELVRRRPGVNGCWEYTGAGDAMRVTVSERESFVITAERFMFLAVYQHCEDSLIISHGCGNERCVRPEHLHSGIAAQQGEYLSSRDAALLLHTTPHAICRAIRQGKLAGTYVSARAGYRITRSALNDWLYCGMQKGA